MTNKNLIHKEYNTESISCLVFERKVFNDFKKSKSDWVCYKFSYCMDLPEIHMEPDVWKKFVIVCFDGC